MNGGHRLHACSRRSVHRPMLLAWLPAALPGSFEKRRLLVGEVSTDRERDIETDEQLRYHGWVPLRFWEHEVREDPDRVAGAVATVVSP